MSDRETGVEEARKVLGKLVDDAALEGEVTYLTRRGRRHAAIVPLDRIKEIAVQNTQRLAEQITPTLGDVPQDFDLDAIVEEIGEAYGFDIDVNAIPSEEYWAIVGKHDVTA